MNKMKAVLIANGEIKDYEYIKEYIKNDCYIISVDGGFDHLLKLGKKPDILIGDLDSVKGDNGDIKKVVFPVKKDFTDSELAIEYAIDKGFSELVLIGFLGDRMDHTLTNIFLLSRYDYIDIIIIDEHNEIRLGKEENVISGKKGDIVSLIPICEDLEGVTTKGLEYPLMEEKLLFGMGRGVSNKMTGDIAFVNVKKGKFLLIKSID